MFGKAKTSMVMSAVAAVLSIGCIGSAFAASADTATQRATEHKDVMNGWGSTEKGEHGKPIKTITGKRNNAELLALLKLNADQLREQLKAGKSLAEIAQAQGVSTDAVIQLLTTQRDKKLADAVKNGKLTQEQADKMKEGSADRIKKFVESKHDGKHRYKVHGLRNNAELLALLKLDADQLKQELKSGKSLAEVARAQGVSPDAVISLLTSQRNQRLDAAVESGELTREKADKVKKKMAEGIKRFVEKKFDGSHGHKKEKPADARE